MRKLNLTNSKLSIGSETMKFNILKSNLNDAIQHVAKAVSSRTTIQILSGIKMDLNGEGLTMTASDTDISIQCVIPIQEDDVEIINIEQEGSIVLPARIFVEMIRKMPDKFIEIEVDPNFQTAIRSGSTELQLTGIDPEEYPLLPQLDEQQMLTMPVEKLNQLISETSFAVSPNESTPVLMGVQWQFSNQTITCTATDRHRLARRQVTLDHEWPTEMQGIVISGHTLNELYKIIPNENAQVGMIIAKNQVLFKFKHILFYSRLLEGAYPDTSKIIPETYKTELIINKKMLHDAIDRAYVLSREEKTNIVHLRTCDDQTIEISSSMVEYGKITDQIEVNNMSGETLAISFNSKYMLDALKATEAEEIHIGFTGAMSPIIIKDVNDSNGLHLILPYRTAHQ